MLSVLSIYSVSLKEYNSFPPAFNKKMQDSYKPTKNAIFVTVLMNMGLNFSRSKCYVSLIKRRVVFTTVRSCGAIQRNLSRWPIQVSHWFYSFYTQSLHIFKIRSVNVSNWKLLDNQFYIKQCPDRLLKVYRKVLKFYRSISYFTGTSGTGPFIIESFPNYVFVILTKSYFNSWY